jgi:hypothetical protein
VDELVMRKETKELIQSKLHRWLEGEQTHALDPNGSWVHVRDIRSIIDCETELLKKQIENLKKDVKILEAKV